LKTLGRSYGLAVDVLDAMTGYARKTGGDKYGVVFQDAMIRELSKIPTIDF
jgi:hypothetical protein